MIYLLKISRIHPAITITIPLPLWHLKSVISVWEGGYGKPLMSQVLHVDEDDVMLMVSFSPLQDLPCIFFSDMLYTLFIGLQVLSASKFTFTFTIYTVLHMLYTCSLFSVKFKTGFTQLTMLHSFRDWLIGHW